MRIRSCARQDSGAPACCSPNLEVNFKVCQTAPMQDGMTIGELARSVGIADSTIRFYERLGLLRPAGRTSGNYRYYGSEASDRLNFIRASQAAGFELMDIKSMLAFQDGHVTPCAEVRGLVSTRLTSVRDQLRKLRNVERVLLAFHRACEGRSRVASCPVLETLSPPGRRRTPSR